MPMMLLQLQKKKFQLEEEKNISKIIENLKNKTPTCTYFKKTVRL